MKKNIAGRMCSYMIRGMLVLPLLAAAVAALLVSLPFLLKKRRPFR